MKVARSIMAAAALSGALAVSGAASANITFTLGNHPQPDEENLLFGQADTIPGLTQTGTGNQTGTTALFTTVFTAGAGSLGGGGTGQFFHANGIGQADLVCGTGGTACVNNSGPLNPNANAQLNSLDMRPIGSTLGWGDVIFNPDFGIGQLNIFVQDNLGNNFNYALGPGQNYITITASGGEMITDVQLSHLASDSANPFGWNEFQQPRVSGVVSAVPAPALGHGAFAAFCIFAVLASQRLKFRRRDKDNGSAAA